MAFLGSENIWAGPPKGLFEGYGLVLRLRLLVGVGLGQGSWNRSYTISCDSQGKELDNSLYLRKSLQR